MGSTYICPVLRGESCYFFGFPQIFVERSSVFPERDCWFLLIRRKPGKLSPWIYFEQNFVASFKIFLCFSLFKLFENYNSAIFGKRLYLEDTVVLNAKKTKGHASRKSVSFFVVASITTCRVLRTRKTKFWYPMSLVPEIAISLKPDWWLPLNRKDGKKLSKIELAGQIYCRQTLVESLLFFCVSLLLNCIEIQTCSIFQKDFFSLVLRCWWKQKTAGKNCFDKKHPVFCGVETNLFGPVGREVYFGFPRILGQLSCVYRQEDCRLLLKQR